MTVASALSGQCVKNNKEIKRKMLRYFITDLLTFFRLIGCYEVTRGYIRWLKLRRPITGFANQLNFRFRKPTPNPRRSALEPRNQLQTPKTNTKPPRPIPNLPDQFQTPRLNLEPANQIQAPHILLKLHRPTLDSKAQLQK